MSNPALPAFAIVMLTSLGLLLWLFLSAAFLLWGARLAGVEKRSFGRAIGTILLGGIASLLLKLVLSSAAPVIGTGLGILLGFCVSSLVMMVIFDTTFGKALAAIAVRQNESRELWADILELATTMTDVWSKETKLGAGARYIIKHFDKLTKYLDDPRLEPTNNLRERMLRMEKLIEGGSMFRLSLEGRFVLDVVRTVLQTAVAAGVPVHEYLVSLLRSSPSEVAEHPERFTPRAWAAASAKAKAGARPAATGAGAAKA